ncbi:hypothetical protein [Candidatus Venteria ishoeyi]|uniref:Uncharacterized protein n=1 Tax=Candidatus Venteria ishoeyi TaxID=1899563 RepID=A0A1H6F6T5_9GAMM|nr:hypothetical protein [Candidatus Venteria ishoeyi]SEH05009.1 Uncharacterised protein [Candidatus Venteria ishoeyi]
MLGTDVLSTWELFLGEISRNISPDKDGIENNLKFLVDRNACAVEYFNAIVSVRYMAAYEQAINEYLHPPTEFKQANIKAELIHFGSLFESLSGILLSNLYNREFTLVQRTLSSHNNFERRTGSPLRTASPEVIICFYQLLY